ncbi:MAG: DUF6502 family protein [Myxococcota bacterium]
MSESGVEAQPLGTAPAALVAALRRLLRPLVHLLLSHQVQYPQLAKLLKTLYVEIAADEFRIAGKPATASRLTLLTGIHRKETGRLREASPEEDAVPATVTLGGQLVARWIGSSEFRGADGRPLALPRTSRNASGPSFERLVTSVSKDIRSRSVLDEWLQLGVAHLDDESRVCLNVDAFVPEKGFAEKAFYFGRNLRDHIAAAAANLSGDRAPMLERAVYYGGLTDAALAELEALSRQLGTEALRAVNERALELKQRDSGEQGASGRMTLGIYFFKGSTDGAADDEKHS